MFSELRKNRLCILFSHGNNYVFRCVIIILNTWRWSLRIRLVDQLRGQCSEKSTNNYSVPFIHLVPPCPQFLLSGLCILGLTNQGSCSTVLLFTTEKNQLSGSTQLKSRLFRGQLYIAFSEIITAYFKLVYYSGFEYKICV